jgi:hypothetical protein
VEETWRLAVEDWEPFFSSKIVVGKDITHMHVDCFHNHSRTRNQAQSQSRRQDLREAVKAEDTATWLVTSSLEFPVRRRARGSPEVEVEVWVIYRWEVSPLSINGVRSLPSIIIKLCSCASFNTSNRLSSEAVAPLGLPPYCY